MKEDSRRGGGNKEEMNKRKTAEGEKEYGRNKENSIGKRGVRRK